MIRDIIRDALDAVFKHARNPRTRLHRLQRRRARLEEKLARLGYRNASHSRIRRVGKRLYQTELLIEDTKREIREQSPCDT